MKVVEAGMELFRVGRFDYKKQIFSYTEEVIIIPSIIHFVIISWQGRLGWVSVDINRLVMNFIALVNATRRKNINTGFLCLEFY